MIICRKINSERELKDSNSILKNSNIIETEHSKEDIKYILIEDNDVKGVCRVLYDNSIGLLDYIVIDKKEIGSNLGDALLRATFNNCLNNGIKKIYFKDKDIYLLKKGFKEKHTLYEGVNYLIEIDLEDFFSIPCKH